MQSMSDGPIAACQECGAPVERVFHPVAVHFKGSGFYTTDYGRNRSGAGAAADSSKDESSESKGADKETTASKSESSGGSDSTAGGSSDS
jgi:predicted nucleic acid-binding Zn ribbon protein